MRNPSEKWTLKALKTMDGPDGEAWTASLYRNGAKVGKVHQSGWGGPNRYHFHDPAYEAELREDSLEFLRANEGWWTEFLRDDGTMYEAEDAFIGEVKVFVEVQKDTKRILRRDFVIRLDDGKMLAWPRKKFSDARIRTMVEHKYPGATVLNDLSVEEASDYLVNVEG